MSDDTTWQVPSEEHAPEPPASTLPVPVDPTGQVDAPPVPVEPDAVSPMPAQAVPTTAAGPVPAAPRPRVPIMLVVTLLLAAVLTATVVGGVAGVTASRWYDQSQPTVTGPVLSSTNEPVAAAAAVALPSVVNIDVTGSSAASGLPGGHPDVPSEGTGSGVAYKSTTDGGTYIITNNHVITDASAIVVTPADGERYDATLIGADPETDIAVVRIGKKLPLIGLGDSEKLAVGQMVIAIGSPFGLQHSVSSGVVSALHRSITSNYSLDTSASAYPLVDVIQTDAAINPGNSGGALVDRSGRLVGIDSAIYSDSGSSAGVGFAIPAKTALRIADELIAGKTATHPFLGVEGLTLSATDAKRLGLTKPEGALIKTVFPDTGAAKAGLKVDDVVLAVGTVPVRSMDDLILQVRRTQVGDRVTLKVWRNRAKITIEMVVGDKPTSLS
ncbi:MAG TPA: trypsin-like peptidase domain-containing protein [Coriobacteriia bacterium]